MQYGKTEADTLRLNGWGKGDILEGQEGHQIDQILITQVGEEAFLCRWKHANETEFGPESSNTTLTCRDWKKVGAHDANTGSPSESTLIQQMAWRIDRLESAINRVLTEGSWPGDGDQWSPCPDAVNGLNDAVSEDPEAAIDILHASIAEDIFLALRQGAERHHLDKAPSAAQAVSFLLSLARQEAEKRAPLKLSPSL